MGLFNPWIRYFKNIPKKLVKRCYNSYKMLGVGEGGQIKDLKHCLKNLKMDETNVKVDTSLAEEYLEKFNSKVYSDAPICQDDRGNKLHEKFYTFEKTEGGLKNRQIGINIIDLLVKNTELLAQLDYLIRGTNPEYVKKFDIPILINSFKRHIYGNVLEMNLICISEISLQEQEPLSKLGLIANQLCHSKNPIYLRSHKNTGVLCHLFMELCIKAGVPEDFVSIAIETFKENYLISSNRCNAVVTSKCDIDSAISTLLNSTQDYKYPWKLGRIFVQENVYDQFKSNLAHITTKKIPDNYIDLKNNSMDVQMYSTTVLIFDHIGQTTLEWQKPFIFIESYRTTKELLSLLIKYPSDYLSLWCSDISTSNEITSKSNAQVIWINDIADFEGSTKLINYQYEQEEMELKQQYYQPNFDKKTVEDWGKKCYEERKNILLKVFDDVDQQLFINGWKKPSSFETSNEKFILETVEPIGFSLFNFPEMNKTSVITNAFIGSLLLGNSIAIVKGPVIPNQVQFDALRELGVPIEKTEYGLQSNLIYKHKIIVCHFGESFAN